MIQVLFGFGWGETVTSVSWVGDDGLVIIRVRARDGSTFERLDESPTLRHVWADESSYSFYRPALVATLHEAFSVLGTSISVLDHFPEGPLEAPTYQWKFLDRYK